MSDRVVPSLTETALDNSSHSITVSDDDESDVCDLEFHHRQFQVALSIHLSHLLFGPLVIPLVRRLFGRALCYNMSFRLCLVYLLELVCHTLYTLAAALYIFNSKRADDFRIVIIATVTTVSLRVLMVSLKYGTLSKKWWRKLNSKVLEPAEVARTLLRFAWKNVPDDVAAEQIKQAFGRLPLEISTLHVTFRSPLSAEVRSRLKAFHTSDTVEECPADLSSANTEKSHSLARLLMNDVLQTEDRTGKRILFWVAVGYSLSPHVIRLLLSGTGTYSLDAVELLYTPLSLGANWFFPFGMLQFIHVGVLDFQRKILLMSQCSALISRHDHAHLLEDLPEVDFSDPKSVFGWYYMRRAFLDIGKRFATRVHLYASLILPILIAAVVMLLLQMVGIIGKSYNIELLCPLYLTFAFDYIIIRMIMAALELNNTFAEHSDLLLESISRLRDNQTGAKRALKWTVRKLELDQALRPAKMLGVTIDESLVNSLLALAVSGAFALLQVLLV